MFNCYRESTVNFFFPFFIITLVNCLNICCLWPGLFADLKGNKWMQGHKSWTTGDASVHKICEKYQ